MKKHILSSFSVFVYLLLFLALILYILDTSTPKKPTKPDTHLETPPISKEVPLATQVAAESSHPARTASANGNPSAEDIFTIN